VSSATEDEQQVDLFPCSQAPDHPPRELIATGTAGQFWGHRPGVTSRSVRRFRKDFAGCLAPADVSSQREAPIPTSRIAATRTRMALERHWR
jgi:uncharacterized membrane protein